MNNYKLDIELFGFCGKYGVGKNYVAENVFNKLINNHKQMNTLVLAFADHFKIDMCAKHNFNYDAVFYEKDEETRKQLQSFGTEHGRDKYGENIWVDTMIYWIQTHYDRGVRRFIITDVRFENEMTFIKKCGGHIIHINAPDRNTSLYKNNDCSLHISETSINMELVDFSIDNNINNINMLEKSVKSMINYIYKS